MSEALDQKLLRLRRQIEEAQSTLDQSKGRLEGLKERAKKEFGAASLKEAEQMAEDLAKRADDLDAQVSQGLQEIKEKYGLGN